jgi:hypothetical protein
MKSTRTFALIAAAVSAGSLSACATVEEVIAENTTSTYRATLTGGQEPGGGDRDGAGSAEISISDNFGQICYDLNNVRNIGPITGAHIHRGAPGVNGPVVFTLRPANEGGYKGCTDGSEWTQDRIENDPALFYVNVHTADYPDGAIRGQLRR